MARSNTGRHSPCPGCLFRLAVQALTRTCCTFSSTTLTEYDCAQPLQTQSSLASPMCPSPVVLVAAVLVCSPSDAQPIIAHLVACSQDITKNAIGLAVGQHTELPTVWSVYWCNGHLQSQMNGAQACRPCKIESNMLRRTYACQVIPTVHVEQHPRG
jgi:hypothetical protein